MWMTEYIEEIKAWFKTRYSDLPNIPDGEYDIRIDGKIDHVVIKKGKIDCCNF